jgi:arylsulfatase
MSNQKRPNILWYCSDQQRWDTIAALGNKFISTNNLDALIYQGFAFEKAYTQSPICTPARASFLTGRYPASHHVYRNGNSYFPSHEKLLPKILSEAGYDCALVGKLHLAAAKKYETRTDDGYRVFHWSHHPTPDQSYGHDYENWLKHEKKVDPIELFSSVNYFCGPGVPTEFHQTTWCSDMAIRFITERRNKPWMISVNPFDPHGPFDAPPEYLSRYKSSEMPLPIFKDSDIENQKLFKNIDQQTKISEDPRIRKKITPVSGNSHDSIATAHNEYDALEVKANYYAMIEQIDDQFGRIIQTLKDSNQLENTLIIYMSDHGELLGDHGLILKGCRFFEGLVRVPMIISWKGKIKENIRSQALVESVDIAPTILDACNLEIPYGMQGLSLMPILTGKKNPDFHKEHVISEYREAMGGHDNNTHASMVFDGRFKSIFYHGHNIAEIFDLDNDPNEFNNLWLNVNDDSFKLFHLRRHMNCFMKTVDVGPPRIFNY